MNGSDRWQIEILPTARRELISLRKAVQDRIRVAIRSLADDPTPQNSIAMKGKGTGLHRLRVGNYRIVYRLQRRQIRILVIRIAHRSEVYRGWEQI